MQTLRSTDVWRRFDAMEQAACVRFNRVSRHGTSRQLFTTVSRLGDGAFWCLLMLAFAAGSQEGAVVALQMAVAATLGLALYRPLKHRLVRERPYSLPMPRSSWAPPRSIVTAFPRDTRCMPVCFTTIAVTHVPELGLLLWPLTLLVASSRVVLGLHYPDGRRGGRPARLCTGHSDTAAHVGLMNTRAATPLRAGRRQHCGGLSSKTPTAALRRGCGFVARTIAAPQDRSKSSSRRPRSSSRSSSSPSRRSASGSGPVGTTFSDARFGLADQMGDPAPHLGQLQTQSIDAVRTHSLAAVVGVEQVFELVPECGQQIGVSSLAWIE